MFVVVHHHVNDPACFFADVPGVARNAPAGVVPRQFCPSDDQTAAVCLWEAESVAAVQAYLDPLTGDASRNTYFAVGEAHSIGLPDPAILGST